MCLVTDSPRTTKQTGQSRSDVLRNDCKRKLLTWLTASTAVA